MYRYHDPVFVDFKPSYFIQKDLFNFPLVKTRQASTDPVHISKRLEENDMLSLALMLCALL